MSDNNIIEIIYICYTNDHQLTSSAWDFRTGTNLMNYKGGGGGAALNSLNLLRSEYVLAANLTKPLLHAWPINASDQVMATRFVVPGVVSSMCLSPDGCYLVAGIQETIYIWHVSTGRMMLSLARHYQTVTCLKFNDDGSYFVSTGKDGAVLVWSLAKVLCRNVDRSSDPIYALNDHGLAVMDVHIGVGGLRAYMFTVSLDRSCKIYDLSSGRLLLSVVFSEGLQSVISNAMEKVVYVGTNNGQIFEFYVNNIPKVKEYHIEEQPKAFIGHAKRSFVNCLALSLDGQTLVSGSTDNQVLVWNLPSRQLVKALQFEGPITNIKLRLTNLAIFNPEHKQPEVLCSNLKRMIDLIGQDEQAVELMVSNSFEDELQNIESFKARLKYFGCQSSQIKHSIHKSNCDHNNKMEELFQEVQTLKRINKQLFEVSSKQLLRSKNSTV